MELLRSLKLGGYLTHTRRAGGDARTPWRTARCQKHTSLSSSGALSRPPPMASLVQSWRRRVLAWVGWPLRRSTRLAGLTDRDLGRRTVTLADTSTRNWRQPAPGAQSTLVP